MGSSGKRRVHGVILQTFTFTGCITDLDKKKSSGEVSSLFKWLVWPLGAARIVVVKENIKVRKRKKFQYNRLSGVDKKKKKKSLKKTHIKGLKKKKKKKKKK